MKKIKFISKSLIIIIGIIVFLEIITRAFLYISLNIYFDKFPPSYRENLKQFHLFHREEHKFDPKIYFDIPRGGFFRGPEGRFNSSKSKKDGEIRIMCVGDSTVFGVGLNFDETWPYLLEERLEKKFPDAKINVLNAGIPGACSRQLKRVFQVYLVKYNPDIVIWREENVGNLTDKYKIYPISSIMNYWGWRILYESRLFRVICIITDRYKNNSFPRTMSKVYDFLTWRRNEDLSAVYTSGRFGSDLDIIKHISYQSGIKYVSVVDYVDVSEKGGKKRNLYAQCNCREEDITPCIKTIDALREELKEGTVEDLYVDDCHFTKKGASIIAREVSDFITSNKWIEYVIRER